MKGDGFSTVLGLYVDFRRNTAESHPFRWYCSYWSFLSQFKQPSFPCTSHFRILTVCSQETILQATPYVVAPLVPIENFDVLPHEGIGRVYENFQVGFSLKNAVLLNFKDRHPVFFLR